MYTYICMHTFIHMDRETEGEVTTTTTTRIKKKHQTTKERNKAKEAEKEETQKERTLPLRVPHGARWPTRRGASHPPVTEGVDPQSFQNVHNTGICLTPYRGSSYGLEYMPQLRTFGSSGSCGRNQGAT